MGGSREKGGEGNEIHAPCACGFALRYNVTLTIEAIFLYSESG